MRQGGKRRIQLAIASIVLVGSCVWMLHAGQLPVAPPVAELRQVSLPGYGLFLLCMVGHMALRFARCYFLLIPIAHLSLRRVININAIALALLTFLPLRVGEMARPMMFREKGRLSAWAVSGTVGAERVIDGLLFSLLLLGGLAVAPPQSPLPDRIGALPVPAAWVPAAARLTGAIFMTASVVMAGFYFFRGTARRWTEKVIGLVSPSIATQVADMVTAISDGLRFLSNPRYAVPFVVLSVMSTGGEIWGLEYLAHAVGLPDVTFAQCVTLLGVMAIGFVLPNAPGFFGTVQLSMYAGLAVYLAPESVAREGGVLVFLFYVTYLGLIVLQAGAALLVESLFPEPASAVGASSDGARVDTST